MVPAAADWTSEAEAARSHEEQWREEFEESLRRIEWGDVNWRKELRVGVPHEEILASAREHLSDVIVMGSTGRSRLARLLVGSVTRRVLRSLPCSLLTVKEEDVPDGPFGEDVRHVNLLRSEGHAFLTSGCHLPALRKFRQVLAHSPFHGPHPPADVQQLVHPFQRTVQDHRPRRFRGDVAAVPEGDAHGGGRQGGGVVDAVAQEDGIGPLRLPLHQLQLLLGTLAGVDLFDPDFLGQVARLGFPVAGDEQDALDVVAAPEVAEEGRAVRPGFVAEAAGRGDVVREILRVAVEAKAGLIVLGTHGRTGLGRLVMGSVAEQVLRKAPCLVLTVRVPFPAAAPEAAGADRPRGADTRGHHPHSVPRFRDPGTPAPPLRPPRRAGLREQGPAGPRR